MLFSHGRIDEFRDSVFLDTLLLSQQIQHVGTGRKHPGPEAARRFRRQVGPEFQKAAFQMDSLSLTVVEHCGLPRTRLTS